MKMNISNALMHLDEIEALPKIDLNKFRNLFMHPNWNYIHELFVQTRNYERGVYATLILIDILENYKNDLTLKEYESFGKSLYLFLLHLLDKADRWEDYLLVWEKLKAESSFYNEYSKAAKTSNGSEIAEFILKETENYLNVHFLYGTTHRKLTIERKLNKKNRGAKIGNLYHATINELSNAQINERVEWVNKIFSYF